MVNKIILTILAAIAVFGGVALIATNVVHPATATTGDVTLYENKENHSEWSGVIVSAPSNELEAKTGWQEGDKITVQVTNQRTGMSFTTDMFPDSPE